MRAGVEGASQAPETKFSMVAHAGLRSPLSSTGSGAQEVLPSSWLPLLPTVAFSEIDSKLYVIQEDSKNPPNLTSFSWETGIYPDLQVETEAQVEYDTGEGSSSFPVPKNIKMLIRDVRQDEISVDIGPTDKFNLNLAAQNPFTGDIVRGEILAPMLQGSLDNQEVNFYTQTWGVKRIFLPSSFKNHTP